MTTYLLLGEHGQIVGVAKATRCADLFDAVDEFVDPFSVRYLAVRGTGAAGAGQASAGCRAEGRPVVATCGEVWVMAVKRSAVGDMVGEVLTNIDIDPSNNAVMLRTASGRLFLLYHEQDCCESVTIVGVDGDVNHLLGRRLEEVSSLDVTPEQYTEESRTDTDIVFRVTDATVTIKWIGESNGYYSEEVDVYEVLKESE